VCLATVPLLTAREGRGSVAVHRRWHHRLHRSPFAILSVSCAASYPLPLFESPKGMLPACDAFAPVPLLAPVGGECSLGPCLFYLKYGFATADRTCAGQWSSYRFPVTISEDMIT